MRPIILITQTFLDISKLTNFIKNSEGFTQGHWLDIDLEGKKDLDDLLSTIYIEYSQPTFCYLGDLSSLSENFQQACLKLLEEPPTNLQIYLSAKTTNDIIDTIYSRSTIKTLPDNIVLDLLDQKLVDICKKKLPPVRDNLQKLINKTLSIEDFGDLPKIERDELQFYIWQLTYGMGLIYKARPEPSIGEIINNLLQTQQFLGANLQKKIALVDLIST